MRIPVSATLLGLVLALVWPTAVVAEAPRHVRPVGVIAQLEYCRALVEEGWDLATLEKCFRHAARILDEGMRSRAAGAGAGRSEDFEARLAAGVRDISSRLDSLPFGDRKLLERDLGDLDAAILSLRVELSRIAASEHMELSLVSRGGASLGNWQAGFLYSVTEWAKAQSGRRSGPGASNPAFSTVTGASAGAVNGFAATIEGCRQPNHSAAASLYYQVWIDLGLFGRHGKPGLFPGPESGSTTLSLFSGDALQATFDTATKYLGAGGQLPSCSVDFGFVATHLDPTVSPVHVRELGEPILTTKKLKEKFSVRLEFSDEGVLTVRNIGPPRSRASDQVYYAGLGHTEEVPLQTLMLGVQASGAFPGAFPPVPLAYTQYVPGPNDVVLPAKRVATFIDGGILDNTPVGLAVTLDAWRGDSSAPQPELEGLVPPEPRTYLFLEPLVRSWVVGEGRDGEERGAERTLLDTYLSFTGDLLATSTDAQLSNTAEQFAFVRRESRDWTQPRLSVPERHMPITGARFEHFMAFLEQDFRIFDFYVGMADAYAHLAREGCLLAGKAQGCEASENVASLDAALKEANPNYLCIRAYYDSEESRVLKRIGAGQLPEECRTLEEVACEEPQGQDSEEAVEAFLQSRSVLSGEEDRCIEPSIANHNFRALLVSMHNYKVWMQSREYSEASELDRFFEELSDGDEAERFIYVDLPTYLGRKNGYMEPRETKQAFRSLVQEGINELAAEQSGLGKYALLVGGRPAADAAFGKAYPKRILGLGIAQSGLELVYGSRILRSAWRWDSTFRYFRLGNQSYAPWLEPFTGDFYAATQLTRILSPVKYLDLELGAGWALSEKLAYNSTAPGHVVFRTGPRGYVALVLLQRLYLSLNVDYYPISDLARPYRNVGTEVVEDWNFNLAAGWRFLW